MVESLMIKKIRGDAENLIILFALETLLLDLKK